MINLVEEAPKRPQSGKRLTTDTRYPKKDMIHSLHSALASPFSASSLMLPSIIRFAVAVQFTAIAVNIGLMMPPKTGNLGYLICLLLSVSLLSGTSVDGLAPANPPPKIYQSASQIPSPPDIEYPFTPTKFDDALLSIFRWTLQRQSGVISDIKGFDGMIAELHELRLTRGIEELERVSSRTMTALAGPIPFIYRSFFKEWDATPALLAAFAKLFLPFLVGEMTLTTLSTEGGDAKGGGLLVERCRVLEGSGCKGICSKMCKVPTERFFAERWGVPLSMEPNFETGACQLRFGVEPLKLKDDATIPPGCLCRCPTNSGSGKEPLELC